MKFDLAMTHADYNRQSARGLHAPQGESALHAAWSTIKRQWSQLLQALQPRNFDEEYLNRAQNHADLERRMMVLMSPERKQGPWGD